MLLVEKEPDITLNKKEEERKIFTVPVPGIY